MGIKRGVIEIKTYQDLNKIGENESARMRFVIDAINDHKSSDRYSIAKDAELYAKEQNPTIMRFQKFVTNVAGAKVPDIWSPNHKIASNWYFYFTTQAIQYLLGNGVQFENTETKKKLGKTFDRAVQEVARNALNGGTGFGFWNYDHIEPIKITEFVPLYDEENGALRAGIRFWQLKDDKPLRITLYEEDGYTDYIKRSDKNIEVYKEKRDYKQIIKSSVVDGEQIYNGGNYPSFPIVPMFNVQKQSELVGKQGTLDAYDLMASGLINNVDNGEFIYWILKNCEGMSEEDDEKFVEMLHTVKVAHVGNGEEGAGVEAHKVEVPFQASQTALAILEDRLYKDFMALRVESIAAGSVTATQILAAYEPINEKTDEFEYCVNDFINEILALAGIEDEPSYVRSVIVNQSEEIQTILSAAQYLGTEFVIKKICAKLGYPDDAEEIIKNVQAEEAERYKLMEEQEKLMKKGKEGDIE